MPTGSQTFFTMNPDGTISFVFNGVIIAQGVTLPAAATEVAITDINVVRWEVSDNTVGTIFTVSVDGTESEIHLGVRTDPTGPTADYIAYSILNEAGFFLRASDGVDSVGRILLSTKGEACFIQAPQQGSDQKIVQYFGQVSSAGAIAAIGSDGWTVVRNSVGNYTVTITDTDATAVFPTANVIAGVSQITAMLSGVTARTFTFLLRNNAGTLTDAAFYFACDVLY